MLYLFHIHQETPAKKNSRIINTKTGRSFPSKKYTEWHNQALTEIKSQMAQYSLKAPISERVEIDLRFIHGDKRRRDSDNGVSSIFDLLVDAGILSDDNYNIIVKHTAYNYYKKNEPSCLIRIVDYEGIEPDFSK